MRSRSFNPGASPSSGAPGSGSIKLAIYAVGAVMVAILALTLGGKTVEENQAGFMQVKQRFPDGKLTVINEAGYFGQWFSTLTQYKQAGTYVFSSQAETSAGGDESIAGRSIPVRFSDGGTAEISGSARFDVPTDELGLLRIHSKYRSYGSLVNNLVKPAIREAVVLSAALMTSEESYSGGKAELSQYALDQLQNGIYLTDSEEVEVKDDVTGKTKTERIVKIRLSPNGEPLRKPNTLAQYGVEISQLFFPDDFAYEEKILEQIGNVRDARMKTTAAFARAEAAAQNEKTAEAEGRARVAEAKAAAEVVKQKAVTAAEQERDVAVIAAESRRQVAEQDKAAAEMEKQRQILLGQGEAERKRLVMQADGALAAKLTTLENINKVWADAFAQRQVPGVVMGGSGDSTDTDAQTFMRLLTMKSAQDLAVSTQVRQ